MKTFRHGLAVLLVGAAAAGLRAAFVEGEAVEVGSNIVHPNGNVYDQVLLRGATATIGADPGQVTRISFIDLNDDIVQVEFGGRGTLTVTLENASGPAAPAKYNQPGVQYMRGHASLEIADPDATTNITVFAVGRCTAVNPALFPDGVTYDGFADLGQLRILRGPGQPGGSTFGGIRTGNVHYFHSTGGVGIWAGNVHVQGPVIIGDVEARDDAGPMLVFGDNSQFGTLQVAGGDLFQPNGRPIMVRGFTGFNMVAGSTADCATIKPQQNLGTFVTAVVLP